MKMSKSVTLEEFYKSKPELKFNPNDSIRNINGNEIGHFNVLFPFQSLQQTIIPYNRRDFYKVSLIIGTGILNYADKAIEIDGNALFFQILICRIHGSRFQKNRKVISVFSQLNSLPITEASI